MNECGINNEHATAIAGGCFACPFSGVVVKYSVGRGGAPALSVISQGRAALRYAALAPCRGICNV